RDLFLSKLLDFTSAFPCLCFPAFLSAGPIAPKSKGDGKYFGRGISTVSLFCFSWIFQNQLTKVTFCSQVQEMDRIYLAYLQNKNRAEGRRSYKAYLQHLGDIYKSCAESDDPNCVASYTTRPKPKPEPPKPAPVKTCDPTKDAYCLYAALIQGKSPYLPLVLPVANPAPAPVKAPAPLYVRSAAPAKDPQSGYHYYAPSAVSFLSKEQKAELLRICAADDVECLQYHLRAAYGYKPSAGPLPSYAHLGCDPKTDPSCKATLVQKAPSGLYMQYPNCDPVRDPFCAYAASLDGCNPLTANRFATPPDSYKNEERDEAAALRVAPSAEQNNDPYAMFRDASAPASPPSAQQQQYPFSSRSYEEPAQEERHPLGPPGKTKEGYDCFIGYDRDCFPLKRSEPRSGVHRRLPYPAEAYEPHVNADGTRNGVLEPSNPHCDPEYDPDCRLRRYEPEQTQAEPQLEHHTEQDHNQGARESDQQPEQQEQDQYEAEPYQSGQEEPHMSYQPLSHSMPSLQDILRRYGDQFPDQDDRRAYADDYRKK
uniref:Uncharacterized protein n=1 Tax=Mola mola TaxID=94237 RepID=A0A3Q3W060_MOLML